MIVSVQGLNKSFNGNSVLKDISFNINEGEILCIIGRSGAGKTTLLRCITGLENCDSGSINIDGMYLCREENKKSAYPSQKTMREIRKNIGMVFQNFNLFPHMSVIENIMEAPVNAFGMSKKEAKAKALSLLNVLGLTERANAYQCELSGGEKQRVAIARACALNPKIMCFDEPTSALDPELKEEIVSIIENLSKNNISIAIITHDMSLVKRVAHRIIFMENGEIIKEETKEEFFNSSNDERIRGFISKEISLNSKDKG